MKKLPKSALWREHATTLVTADLTADGCRQEEGSIFRFAMQHGCAAEV
jgi:hypothetical protein